MIESILVANRGEIALRVIATCRKLGIRSVAVYSDADATSRHVAAAAEAVYIGPSPAADSYLNAAVILDAARRRGVQAIHPGYGFLSENADFAQAVADAGLLWIGPSAAAMRALGDKAQAKALAERCGVPVLRGYHGPDQTPQRLSAEAEQIGWPVLIKAAAGGGGRGMRVVESAGEFDDALGAATREAQASFGDGRVLLEAYVRRPRHVEVQIIGDTHGNFVHLGERECSIQRRHQKLIEESPSPGVDASLRTALGDAALTLARAAGYTNAGTVEFLLHGAREFAFLEVNARLQVEHPVTEMVTRLDLVELQIRVAAGESLPMAQDEVLVRGHAIEARIIAEDVGAGFLPSSGLISQVEGPPDSVRFDGWIEVGTEVSPFYDSLLGKIIAFGATRDAAREKLARAVRDTWIDGVSTNLDLLLAILEHRAFADAELTTDFLDSHAIVPSLACVPPPVLAAVAALDPLDPPRGSDPWRSRSHWRTARIDQPVTWLRGGHVETALVSAVLGSTTAAEVRIDGTTARVQPRATSEPLLVTGQARTAGRLFSEGSDSGERGRSGEPETVRAVSRVDVMLPPDGDETTVTVWDTGSHRVAEWRGQTFRFSPPPPLNADSTRGRADPGSPAGRGGIRAPMPGRIVKLDVTSGQAVVAHQRLIVLEAMKMEHVLEAPHAGVVAQLDVTLGDQVTAGEVLLVLHPSALE